MNEDNVTKLRVAPSPPVTATEQGYIDHIVAKLQDYVEDLFDEHDVDLEAPRSDERVLGRLTAFEKRCFVVGTILRTYIEDELREIEARHAESVAAIMRNDRCSGMDAARKLMADPNFIAKETREFVNLCAVTRSNVMSMYEWGVRSRHDEWDSRLIVRTGFVACAYNE